MGRGKWCGVVARCVVERRGKYIKLYDGPVRNDLGKVFIGIKEF